MALAGCLLRRHAASQPTDPDVQPDPIDASCSPGDELLAVAGAPYDTLEEVIGLRGTPGIGSLADFGVSYRK